MQRGQALFIDGDIGLEDRSPFGKCWVIKRLVEQRVGQLTVSPLKPVKESAHQADARRLRGGDLYYHRAPCVARLLSGESETSAEAYRFAISAYKLREQRSKRFVVRGDITTKHFDCRRCTGLRSHVIVIFDLVQIVEIKTSAFWAKDNTTNFVDQISRPQELFQAL